jgi:hypothetical protein
MPHPLGLGWESFLIRRRPVSVKFTAGGEWQLTGVHLRHSNVPKWAACRPMWSNPGFDPVVTLGFAAARIKSSHLPDSCQAGKVKVLPTVVVIPYPIAIAAFPETVFMLFGQIMGKIDVRSLTANAQPFAQGYQNLQLM